MSSGSVAPSPPAQFAAYREGEQERDDGRAGEQRAVARIRQSGRGGGGTAESAAQLRETGTAGLRAAGIERVVFWKAVHPTLPAWTRDPALWRPLLENTAYAVGEIP